MFLFYIIQLSAILINSGSQGNVAVRHSPLTIKAVPAGDRDGDCATLLISKRNGQGRAIKHSFCRSARIYDMTSGVVIINDNVDRSELYMYHAAGSRITAKRYHVSLRDKGTISVTTFVYKGGTNHRVAFDLTVRTANPRGVGSEGVYYKCLEIRGQQISEGPSRCPG